MAWFQGPICINNGIAGEIIIKWYYSAVIEKEKRKKKKKHIPKMNIQISENDDCIDCIVIKFI